jgi:hypothetical protein
MNPEDLRTAAYTTPLHITFELLPLAAAIAAPYKFEIEQLGVSIQTLGEATKNIKSRVDAYKHNPIDVEEKWKLESLDRLELISVLYRTLTYLETDHGRQATLHQMGIQAVADVG